MSYDDYDEIDADLKARARCEEPEPEPEFYYWTVRAGSDEVVYTEPKDPDGFSGEDRWQIMLDEIETDMLERLPLPIKWMGDDCEVWVDEEGLLKKRAANYRLMEIVEWEGMLPLVGNAVIVPTHMIV